MKERPYTLYRCTDTKALYYELLSNDFKVWIPTITTRSKVQPKDGDLTHTVAAIPGYLFVWYKESRRLDEWGKQHQKVGLRQMMRGDGGRGIPVRLSWLEILHVRLACEAISEGSPDRPIYHVKDRVRIVVGAYAGEVGIVRRVKANGVRVLLGTRFVGLPQQFVEKI